ncbi:hypothetical protein Pla123a_09880 [Posidoniimonas polymericola]|uniref:Thioredoxin domain-containing protein n=1 Tax=Posidoniimonas polymericola TaxID=2528002 RepID=A0A5C5YTB8_9BACT|nr:SCO family protein [Posidoniimonas polymericola]TWT78198.1 hypothetical protein Pla123a_09880 [Posidoniimonas polymericola]
MRLILLSLTALALLGPACAQGQLLEDKPDELQEVGVDEKRGGQIPLNLKFRDENGRAISLADLFDGERPVLLSLNYSDCPMLCRVQLNGLTDALKQMEMTVGEEFDVVSVSIDPRESPQRAKETEKLYAGNYGRAGSTGGWHFLTSTQENITALADAVGFRYKFVPDRGEFAHTAAVMVCSPEGMVSRYLYGVMFEPKTVRLSLVEAADGKVGTAMDQIILFCFHYDETKGRYGPVARNIMSAGAAVTVMALAAGLLPFWVRRGSSASAATEDAAPVDTPDPQAT